MLRRFESIRSWFPRATLLVELAVAGIALAATGGGDFPQWR